MHSTDTYGAVSALSWSHSTRNISQAQRSSHVAKRPDRTGPTASASPNLLGAHPNQTLLLVCDCPGLSSDQSDCRLPLNGANMTFTKPGSRIETSPACILVISSRGVDESPICLRDGSDTNGCSDCFKFRMRQRQVSTRPIFLFRRRGA